MADTKLSALTEATVLGDTDEFYVNDSGTSKRATVATLKDTVGIKAEVDNTRLTSGMRLLSFSFAGPDYASANATIGHYHLSMSYVPAQTPSSMDLDIVTAGASTDCYVVIYTIDPDDGLPGTLVNDWGPFDCSATGLSTITSQTEEVLVGGWYWVGHFNAADSSNNVVVRSFRQESAGCLFTGTSSNEYSCIRTTSVTADNTPNADLSGVSWNGLVAGNAATKVTVA